MKQVTITFLAGAEIETYLQALRGDLRNGKKLPKGRRS